MCLNANYGMANDAVQLDDSPSARKLSIVWQSLLLLFSTRELFHYANESYLAGGEESTIKFMEGQSVVTSSCLPLVDDAYAYGIVHHPFPLNCFLRDWKLGSEFYQAVKIGIVQYVCSTLVGTDDMMFLFAINWSIEFTRWYWRWYVHYLQWSFNPRVFMGKESLRRDMRKLLLLNI